MKIAYLVTWDIFSNDGVTKKIKTQVDFWRKFGHDVQVFCNIKKYTDSEKSILSAKLYSQYFRWSFKSQLMRDLQAFNPDMVYLRFEVFRPYLWLISMSYPVILELNTNDVGEMQLQSTLNIKKRVYNLYHRVTRDFLFKQMAGLVCVTHEISKLRNIKKYNKPFTVVPNSVCLDDFRHLTYYNIDKKPSLAFIGVNNYPWYGLDKIIQLASLSKKINIHIIGTDKKSLSKPYIKPFIETHNFIPSNIFFHGFIAKNEYESIFEQCDVAIGTLALHRNNMNEACPIKVREYIAYGLPVILAYDDTAFIGKKMPDWILRIPNIEDNIGLHLEDILQFANKMKGKRISRGESKTFIDVKELEIERICFFEQLISDKKIKLFKKRFCF